MNNTKIFISWLLFLTSLVQLNAQDAYGIACGITRNADFVNGNIYNFDLADGTGTELGAVSCIADGLLTGEFINGSYYAIGNGSKTVYLIDSDGTCAVASTIVGFPAGHSVTGLSADLTTGLVYLLTGDGGTSNLYTIDIATGVITFIGNTGTFFAVSLAISNNGSAYILDVATDAIHPIDLTTGIAGPGIALTDGVDPVGLNFAQDADFDCGNDGMLAGILYNGGGNASYGILDPSTGLFTVINDAIQTEICGFSVDCRAEVVPTLGQWGLISLSLLLLIIGVSSVKQRESLKASVV